MTVGGRKSGAVVGHIQLATPEGGAGGGVLVHLGVERSFRPARKAHPAFLVRDLPGLAARLRAAGAEPATDEPLDGFDRPYVSDPFGNRIELLEPLLSPAAP